MRFGDVLKATVLLSGGPAFFGHLTGLTIDHRPDRLELTITDNGVGCPGDPPSDGHGIAGMRERVALAGGRFRAGSPTPSPACSPAGGGFEVACTLPAREPT